MNAEIRKVVNKRVAVTGGDGFLGHHVMPLLQQKYKTVINIKHKSWDLLKENEVALMYSTYNPDIVVHLAARVGGIQYNMANPGKLFRENIQMGINLIHQGFLYGRIERFVCIGTICSYPKVPLHIPFKESDLWLGYPEDTNASYGIAKLSLLTMCQAYRKQYGMNCIYLMPTNEYGEWDTFTDEQGHVIPMLIKRFIEAKEQNFSNVVCWGTGNATREFLYAGDCAEAIVLATEKYNSSEPINIGSGEEILIKDLAEMIAELVGYKGKIEFDPSMPDGQPRRFLDVFRAERELGWKASTPLGEGLNRTIDWYMGNRS